LNSHQTDVLPIAPDRIAEWVVLLVQLPGLPPRRAGVMLLDPVRDQLHIALVEIVFDDQDAKEIWESPHQDLIERSAEKGGAYLLDSLETDLSNFLQIDGPRQQIPTADPRQTLAMLFQRYILNNSALSQGS
jgi:hypothetical protein